MTSISLANRPRILCTFDRTLLVSRAKYIFRPVLFKIEFLKMYLAPFVRLGTPKFRRFILNLIPWKPLHELRDISDVFHNTAVEIVNSKKRAIEDGDEAVARQMGQGKDILSILSRFLIPRLWMGFHFCPLISARKSGCFRGG